MPHKFQGVSIGMLSGLALTIWLAVGAAFTMSNKINSTEENMSINTADYTNER
jgi:hypothetical protein